MTAALAAWACLATLVSASATTKYAVASIVVGQAVGADLDIRTGSDIRDASAPTPARSPPVVSADGRIP